MKTENVVKEVVVDSIKKRYSFSLTSGMVALLSNGLLILLVPKVLGPSAFGNYTFLYNFFLQTLNFIDAGMSMAFFTLLSQQNYDNSLLTFYLSVIFLISSVLALFVFIATYTGWHNFLWPQQQPMYIWLAFGMSLILWFNRLLQKVSDAHAFTVACSLRQFGYRFLLMFVVLGFFYSGKLGLATYFIVQGVVALVFSFAQIQLLIGRKVFIRKIFDFQDVDWRSKFNKFWVYCSPLYIYNVASFFSAIISSWMLQRFSGSLQQGYYGLGFSIATACFVFASAMTTIFTREFALAHARRDLKLQRHLLKRYVNLFYIITAFFSIFCCVNAGSIILIVGGSQFIPALFPLMIIILSPMHQVYGQLIGSAYYASGQTAVYRNIGVCQLCVSIITAYFLLAPHRLGGLHLGAVGTALNLVVIQFISVNVLTAFFVRKIALAFGYFFRKQIIIACGFAMIAIMTKVLCNYFSFGNPLLILIISLLIYSIFFLILILLFPGFIGFSREELYSIMHLGKGLKE